jgi:uncharacterized LabA/DUF88 family protein
MLPGNRAMLFIDGTNALIEMFKLLGVNLRAEKASADAFNLASHSITYAWKEFSGRDMQGHIIVRQYWFGSIQGSEEDLENSQLLLRNLGYEGVLFRKAKGTKKEKGVDLAVARTMLTQGFHRNYDVAMIILGDEDYIGLIDDVKRLGAVVVGMFFETTALSKELRLACDYFHPLYSPEHIAPDLVKTVRDACTNPVPGALKLSAIDVTQSEHGHYHLTLEFDELKVREAVLRNEQKHNEVAARLRKLADEVEALES